MDIQKALDNAVSKLESKIDSRFDKLESRIDKTDIAHQKTNDKQIALERDIIHYRDSFNDFKNQYAIDITKIYNNMSADIKKSVKESVMSVKYWVLGGVITAIIMLAGLIDKIKG